MNETTITVIGNLVADPELRYTPTGTAVAQFRVASTPRYRDNATGEWKDGNTLFLNAQAWRQLAETVAEELAKGAGVIIYGRLRQRTYETQEGEKRTVYELQADEIGRRLRGRRASQAGTGPGNSEDPWANGGSASDEPPF